MSYLSCREAITTLKDEGLWVPTESFGTPGKTLIIIPYAKSAWWSDHAASKAACHPEPFSP